MTTRTTTQHSGPSLAASQSPAATEGGDIYGLLCEEIHRLLTRKRTYYGCPSDDALANAEAVAEDGIWPVTYQVARVGEKLRRLRALTRTMSYDEIRETLKDIAGHAVVALALLEKEKTREPVSDSVAYCEPGSTCKVC